MFLCLFVLVLLVVTSKVKKKTLNFVRQTAIWRKNKNKTRKKEQKMLISMTTTMNSILLSLNYFTLLFIPSPCINYLRVWRKLCKKNLMGFKIWEVEDINASFSESVQVCGFFMFYLAACYLWLRFYSLGFFQVTWFFYPRRHDLIGRFLGSHLRLSMFLSSLEKNDL